MNFRFRVTYRMTLPAGNGQTKLKTSTRNVEVPVDRINKKCLNLIRQVLVDTHKNETVEVLSVVSRSGEKETWIAKEAAESSSPKKQEEPESEGQQATSITMPRPKLKKKNE